MKKGTELQGETDNLQLQLEISAFSQHLVDPSRQKITKDMEGLNNTINNLT